VLVLQATNAGARRPGYEASLHVLSCYSSYQWWKIVKFIYLIKGLGGEGLVKLRHVFDIPGRVEEWHIPSVQL